MIDDQVTESVRRAAGAVPANAPDLQSVYHRHRRRRVRHAVASGAAVLVLLTGAGVGLAKLTPSGAPTPAATVAATERVTPTSIPSAPAGSSPASAAPATDGPAISVRRHNDSLFEDKAGHEVGFRLPRGLVTLQGTRFSTVEQPAELNDVRTWLPRPDGGYVLLGTKDLTPGASRTDGVNVTGLEIRLMTLAADGRVTLSRNVRVKGQDVQLAGVDNGAVYLARGPGGLVRHNLATGAETRIRALDAAVADPNRNYSIQHGVLVSVSPLDCTLRAYDLQGHGLWTLPAGAAAECGFADEAAVTPDGHWLAFPLVTYPAGDRAVTAVATVDLTTGAMHTATISDVTVSGGMLYGTGILGLAWSADSVHVAWPVLPRPLTRMYELSEILQTKDVPRA